MTEPLAPTSRYPLAFARFIAPARRYPQAWRLLLGLVLTAVVYALGVAQLILLALLVTGGEFQVFLTTLTTPKTPGNVLFLLSTFLPMMIGVFTAAAVLHNRGPGTLIGPAAKVLREGGIAVAVMAVVLGLGAALFWLSYTPLPGLPFATWAVLLPLGLLGLLIQTGTEEIVFRGYLQQQLAARYKSRVIWMVAPALIFGAIHYNPAYGQGAAFYAMGAAALFGLVAADLTARSGSLGPAWGMHFANNVFAVLILATQDTIEGLALFRTPYSLAEDALSPAVMVADAAMLILTWLVIRRLIRR